MVSSRTLPERFRHTAKRLADTPAILTDERFLTYADLDAASDAIAAALTERGITPGDRVGLYCPNGADFVGCYLGILKAGACVVPINLLLPPTAIAFVLNDAGAKALCFQAAFAEQAAAALAEAPAVTLCLGIGPVDPAMVDVRLEDLNAVANPPAPVIDPDRDPAVILYTSGTTGRPKGAVLTHANLATNATAVAEVLEIHPGADGDRVLVVLPMFHAFAATVGLLMPLLAGAALVPVARPCPRRSCRRSRSVSRSRSWRATVPPSAGRSPASIHRPGRASRVRSVRPCRGWRCASPTRTDTGCPTANMAKSVCAVRVSCAATGTCPRRPRPASTATGSAPAISVGATATAGSIWSTGSRI